MPLCDVFLGLGQENLGAVLRQISMGKLKTFQMFDRVKTRLRLAKLNQESLRHAAPKVWARLSERDEDLASDLGQAVLVSHMEMIVAVLDSLAIPHRDGFFEKDANIGSHLADGWQAKAYSEFQGKFPPAVLVFYLNHLAHEVNRESPVFSSAVAR